MCCNILIVCILSNLFPPTPELDCPLMSSLGCQLQWVLMFPIQRNCASKTHQLLNESKGGNPSRGCGSEDSVKFLQANPHTAKATYLAKGLATKTLQCPTYFGPGWGQSKDFHLQWVS